MGIIDSLGIMKLIEFMQEIYSIEIAETDIVPNNFENIDAIALFVGRKSA
jgi:acyl carrier protein